MNKVLTIGVLALLSGLFACNDESSGRIIVRLTDSPGDYEEVNVDIVDVQIHREDGEQSDGWESLNPTSGIYNLLDLTDGVETVLADTDIPSGNISQIRLVLGSSNTVTVDGMSYDLTTPSAQQSGLKVQINETLVEGVTYSILLDFDAARSVVQTGSDKYILKPVVRSVVEARDGGLTGTIVPATESVAVYAIIGEDTLGTSYAVENNASWFIGGLEDGNYIISFDPGELSTYQTKNLDNISVTIGSINDIGETILEPK